MPSVQSQTREQEADLRPRQTEFPLRVPLCAWCRPATRGEEMIPHGICPRHFRKMKQQLARHSKELAADTPGRR